MLALFYVAVFNLIPSITTCSLFLHNYSLFCLQPFRKHCTYSLGLYNGDVQNTMQLHIRLNELQLAAARFVLTFYMCFFSLQKVLNVEGSRSSLLENSLVTACICALSHLSVRHAFCCWFIWMMFDVFVSVYLCIVYTSTINL